ncbi:acyl-CoA oxidase [Streptomyces sp. BG9H]|uniref:Acyl-CoA oxidase n=1 Tax=Streptomyces anatolicus TaxID=2675858 RepID=A0ABS6YIT0_9ACTN|nr:acyl-CoA dehydrogenase [Streptomyces anatolicus]MBW5420990.1 acyl-CoA oxidase [Streptomyces anatolicus]
MIANPDTGSACTDATSVPIDLTTTELRTLLFGADRVGVHGPWRELTADPWMHRRHEMPTPDQVAASYQRLRQVNQLTEAAELATDPYRLTALHEWTGPLDGALTVLVGIHYNLFLGSLLDHDAHEKRPLAEYTAMERIGTFLCTELGHGNDATALETTAVYNRTNRTFTLHTPHAGAQKFMPNTSMTGGPKSAVVAARLLIEGRDHGIFLFLTPLTDHSGTLPGVTVRPLPLRPGSPVDHCLTSFDQVLLPHEALLTGAHGRLDDDGTFSSALGSKRKRFLTSISRVTLGKLCMSASALGATRATLAIAIRYAHHREVTGARPDRKVPLWAHRTHHGPLLEGIATAYAMTALHRTAVTQWAERDRADPTATALAEREAAVAKGWITWQARALLTECRERCGAQGLLPVNGIVSATIDVEGTITAEGDNLALWVKTGAELLLDHDTPPATPPRGELTDPAVRQQLLHMAEHLLLVRARTRLRQAPAGDSLRRWNAAAPAVLAAVTAHAEHRAATALLAMAESAADPQARAALLDLHQLFTLRCISAHTVTLLSEQHLTAGQASELPDLIEEGIGRLTDQALVLIDAFDLPSQFFDTRPIANPDYQEAFDDPAAHWNLATRT